MNNILTFIVLTLLFVLLSPQVVVELPPKGDHLTVAIVHGIIFAIIVTFLLANNILI